jgi:hypothetical protein
MSDNIGVYGKNAALLKSRDSWRYHKDID